ncbi:alpha-E domain-containing protein [Pseudoxanthobacter sp.]|uniref:alpha-E domain-containing protein n=1 Tax=Pseudoxanthobacter sp. TaxID=1925742 RepID=UPI002FE37C54
MLSRTAETLYWLARYVERAENTARIIDGAARLSAMPAAYAGGSNEWEKAIAACGSGDLFQRLYGEANQQTVVEFLGFSTENPSSIRVCLENARHNARAVRTALTIEMWEAINGAWLEMKRFSPESMTRTKLQEFLSFVKEANLRFDGSAYRTMLRDDAYDFFQLGVYIERADATARIIDAKCSVFDEKEESPGGGHDYFQWTALLRSVSALTSYHWVYRQSIKPDLVADLLILNRRMPRSIASCYENITRRLDLLARGYGRPGPSQRLAYDIYDRLNDNDIRSVMRTGLHRFLTEVIDDNNRLGAAITEQYLV